MSEDKGYFQDERGSRSMGRVGTFVWTVFCIYMVGLHWATISAAVLAFLSTIELAFISWNAGPRIASYIAPQLSAVASSIGKAIAGRRDAKEGIDPSKE